MKVELTIELEDKKIKKLDYFKNVVIDCLKHHIETGIIKQAKVLK